MEEVLEIVLRAIDNASSVFSSVTSSAEEMGTGFDDIGSAATGATGSIQDVIDYCQSMDGTGPQEAAAGMDELESATSTADAAVEDLGADLDIINAGMLLQTAEQISNIAGNAEGMAQEMNTAAITVGQLATQTGIAEPQMVSLINSISNATFPNEEAMMYVKSLDQMGVASENFAESATNIDRINDAFGMGAQTTNSLAQELGVLGVDMNNVSSAFNALAYANANTVGGMQNYYTFLRKYDSQFKELGFDVDQSSIIIAAATQKYGGGRAALSGLSSALEEADGDTRKLEQALGIQAGTLDHASEVTGQYEGQLEQLAGEEAEHKTLLDQLGAAWEDISLSLSGVLSPLGAAVGLIGEVGSFGMQVNGLIMLKSTLTGVVGAIRNFNAAKTIQNLIEGEGAVASIAAAVGITTEAAAAEGATIAFGGLAVAEGAALWPILAIIAAIALLVAAVYTIGKAFGWWDDVGGMLAAIQDGVMRLWEAFINHPDVQAVISAISWALSTLWSWISQAGQAILEFFGIAESGDFDIVLVIINSIGMAWEFFKMKIMAVITVITTLWTVMNTVFTAIWSVVGPIVMQIIGLVQNLIGAFDQFKNGQISLPQLIMTVLTLLANTYVRIFTYIGQLVVKFGQQLVSRGLSAARGFVMAIVNWVRQLPSRVYSLLIQVVSRIRSGIQAWISAASSKVSSLIKTITSPFSGVAGAISGALSGVVNAITAPFQNAWNRVKPLLDKIKQGLSIIGAAGGETAAGGEFATDTSTGGLFNVATGQYVSGENKLVIEDNINLTLDLANVPAHISTGQLIEALGNKEVLNALVTNRDFQSIDAQVKQRISLKNSRSGR